MPLPPKNELEWWYQYYFATERGRAGYDKYRHDFAKLIWQVTSPKWNFDNGTFERTAASFDNPDHVNIVIHNYRWRLGLAEGEPKYDDLGAISRWDLELTRISANTPMACAASSLGRNNAISVRLVGHMAL